jgi:hypothetical protein
MLSAMKATKATAGGQRGSPIPGSAAASAAASSVAASLGEVTTKSSHALAGSAKSPSHAE